VEEEDIYEKGGGVGPLSLGHAPRSCQKCREKGAERVEKEGLRTRKRQNPFL